MKRTSPRSHGSWILVTSRRSAAACVVAIAMSAAHPGFGVLNVAAATHYPVAALLCTSPDQGSTQELATGYYQDLFSPGTGGAADYFQEISRGAIDLGGTQVLGPYSIASAGPAYPPGTAMTLQRMNGLRRFDRLQACAGAAADAGVDLTAFQEVIAIEIAHEKDPSVIPPNAVTTLAAAASSSDTTIHVTSSSGFPTPPFPAMIGVGDPQNGGTLTELVDITGESGTGNTTWTVARGFEEGGPGGLNNCAQGGPSPSNGVALAAGLQVGVPYTADGGACFVGRVSGFHIGSLHPETLNNVGLVAMDPLMSIAVLPHEMSHALFGLVHSSDLLVQSDYKDAWDMMSAQRTYRSATEPSFVQSFHYDQNPEGYSWFEGPGFNSVFLNSLGWLSSGLEDTTLLSAAKCTSRGVRLDPLSIRSVSPGDYLDAQLPFTNQAGFPSASKYTVEFRDPIQGSNYTVWDAGVPKTVLIHVAGKNSSFPSYLVDTTVGGALTFQGVNPGGFEGGTPEFVNGSTFVDPTSSAYVAVNELTDTALITIGNCTLPTLLTYSGDTSGDFNDTATLAADLMTNPSSGPSGPVPNQPLTLSVGSQSCPATTDVNGHASCNVIITQHPASVTVTAAFAGTAAYAAASATSPFSINKEESRVTYAGALTQDYHDQFTASATLTDPVGGAPIPGKPIMFTLGVGDTCGPVMTDGSGTASCHITPTQAAGTTSIVASFSGDLDYLSSADTHLFVITREETTTTYTGPTVIANGVLTKFTAVLKEDGTVPIQFRHVTITLGSGTSTQTCMGTTDPTGTASCFIVPSQPLGPGMVRADFFGDAFYLPSSSTASTILFAFLSRGAFVIGDDRAAIGTHVTFFGPTWSKANLAGTPPRSFKGFASTTAEPPVCGSEWSATPGDSTAPPANAPSYMGVIVTSSVTKFGREISGGTVEIVVVHTSAGYDGHLGTGGTGTVVAVYCHM